MKKNVRSPMSMVNSAKKYQKKIANMSRYLDKFHFQKIMNIYQEKKCEKVPYEKCEDAFLDKCKETPKKVGQKVR